MMRTVIDVLSVALCLYAIYVFRKWSKVADDMQKVVDELKQELESGDSNGY